MKQRLLVAFVGVPFLLWILFRNPPWFTIAGTAILAGIATVEFLHVSAPRIPSPLCAAAALFAGLQTVLLSLYAAEYRVLLYYCAGAAALLFLWSLISVFRYNVGKQAVPFERLYRFLMTLCGFPVFFSAVSLLRCAGDLGSAYAAAPFAVAFCGDACSMFGGMLFGREKLAPQVSPKKTWAGAVTGVFGGAVGMLLYCWLGSRWEKLWVCAIVGCFANCFGQIGDLSMSVVKREYGAKDYGNLFLAHGGVLDRFDSLMFIAPVLLFSMQGGLL